MTIDDLSTIYGIIYKIGNAHNWIVIYSQNYSFSNVFSNKYISGIISSSFPTRKEFKLINDTAFKLNTNPDILYKDGQFYILNLNMIMLIK
ncbi:MAG: hypothetical protein ACRC6K_05870 [Fusobacteriaceae bacterium]